MNLYFSAIVAALVFAEAACGPLYLFGFIIAEGDLIGHVVKAGGPAWLARSFLWVSFIISAVILWRVVPEIRNAWKARFLEIWKSVSPLSGT